METTILIVIQVVTALALIGLILIQHGKGADAGAAFGGGGGSQSLFGSGGSGNFLTKTTALIATIFFAASLGLAYFAKEAVQADSSLFETPVLESVDVDGDLPTVPKGSEDLPIVPVAETPTAADDLPAVDLPTEAASEAMDGATQEAEAVAEEASQALESVADEFENEADEAGAAIEGARSEADVSVAPQETSKQP